jgi:hypothetical protein
MPTSGSVSTPSVVAMRRSRQRRRVAVLAAAGVTAVVVVMAAIAASRDRGQVVATQAPSAVEVPGPVAVQASGIPGATSSAAPAPASASPDSTSTQAIAPAPAQARLRVQGPAIHVRPAASAAPVATAAAGAPMKPAEGAQKNCDPPYVLSPDGVKTFKPECF